MRSLAMFIMDRIQGAYDRSVEVAGPHLWLKITALLTGNLLLYGAYAVYRHLKWPAYTLSGPPFQSILYGSTPKPLPPDFAALYMHERWFQKYGPTLRLWVSLLRPVIMTVDPMALRHMLSSPVYQKGEQLQRFLGDLLGEGLLFVEGAEHKKQRRVMVCIFCSQPSSGISRTDATVIESRLWPSSSPEVHGDLPA